MTRINPRHGSVHLDKVEHRTPSMRWFSQLVEVTDVYLDSEMYQQLFIKSAARKVARDYRDSLPLEQIKVVEICHIDFCGTVSNESGDNVFITLMYGSRGAVSSLGGHWDLDKKNMVWSCYAD